MASSAPRRRPLSKYDLAQDQPAKTSAAEERIIWLTARDAILWLNETPQELGSFWEFEEGG
jgi:hypothetical protein